MIFYLINSFSQKNPKLIGGHYYSLMNIAKEISRETDVAIINIGDIEASALKEWEGTKFFINVSFSTIHHAIDELNKLCMNYQPKILHAFDKSTGYFARRASMCCKIPWVLTKCGGPNPSHKHWYQPSAYYPKAMVQTVFHKNDFDWFLPRFRNLSRLALISARVKTHFDYRDEFSILNNFYSNAEYKLIRIARISLAHYLSLLQSIKLTQRMCELGINAKLAIIGIIDSDELYRKLIKVCGKETCFFTSDMFTYKASDFLPLADIAIGAGRSFMEGCAAGCVMMAPIKESQYPALVTSKNIDYFEAQNFSDRTTRNNEVYPDRDILEYISEIKSNKEVLSKEMRNIYIDRYDVSNAKDKYIQLYEEIKRKKMWEKRLSLDMILHFLWLKYTYKTSLNNKI